mgnify:CR=1 FL=1
MNSWRKSITKASPKRSALVELFWAGSPSMGPEHCALCSEISVFVRFSRIVHAKELLLSCCIEPSVEILHGNPSVRWRQSLASIIFLRLRFLSSGCLWVSNPLTCSLKFLGSGGSRFAVMTQDVKVIDPQGPTSHGMQ